MTETRTRYQIYYDILTVMMEKKSQNVIVINIQGMANLDYDKTREHLSKMQELELITETYIITSKGYSFHKEYKLIIDQVNKLANIMDLDILPPSGTSRDTTAEMVNKITQMNYILKDFEEMFNDWMKSEDENK